MVGILAGAGLLLATSAGATPITYTFASGSAKITASGATSGTATIALTGTQVTFDSVTKQVTSFGFTAGPTAQIAITPILGYNRIMINSASIAPGTGYSNISVTGPFLPADTYFYTVGPVNVSGNATFSNSAGPPPSPLTTPFAFVNPTLSGQLRINTGTNTLSLSGITLGNITTGAGTVTLKADVLFTGVPEPTSALLLGAGLAGLAVAGRRRARH